MPHFEREAVASRTTAIALRSLPRLPLITSSSFTSTAQAEALSLIDGFALSFLDLRIFEIFVKSPDL